MPEISIIIAVYNVERYLRQCLDSLINQTFNNIEIICIDDGSMDNSFNILNEYKEKDDRIIIIEQKNQGPGVARNKGLDIAKGKYIMIVDPDDWLELNTCELAYNQIEKNQNDFVMFDYKKYIEETNKFIEKENHFLPYKDVINEPNINLRDLKTNFFLNGYSCMKLYNKKFLKDNNIRYSELYLCEDGAFSFVALLLSKSFSILNIPLYIYRIRLNSSSYNIKRWKDVIISRKYIWEFIISKKFNNNICKKYVQYTYENLMYWYNRCSVGHYIIKILFAIEIIKYFNMLSKYKDYRFEFIKYFILSNIKGFFNKFIKYPLILAYNKINIRKNISYEK